MNSIRFADVFNTLLDPAQDHAVTVRAAFDAILQGAWTPVQVAGLAVTLRLVGEHPDVIAAAAEAMRAAMIPVEHKLSRVIDTCGTGGDGQGTWNLSTAAAFVVAAAGVPVAKHGNRAVSSRSGSADVLEALGVTLTVAPHMQSHVLHEVGLAFLFAPMHHPALHHGAIARRELGIRTLFNALGPLANPARASHQLLGAYADSLRPILAQTLLQLGTKRAWVVRGADGLDEISPVGLTYVTELSEGTIREFTVTPQDFGLEPLSPSALRGGTAEDNARMIQNVLENHPHPARNAVVINAAAALCVALEISPQAARERAESVLTEGKACAVLEKLIRITKQAHEQQGVLERWAF